MDLGLTAVHVLVTGASGGIGLETTSLFLEQGARVTAHYNTNTTTLTPLQAEHGAEKIQALQADLSNEAEVDRLFAEATRSFGPVQILIINHAVSPVADEYIWEMSYERWKKTIDINLNSSFLVAREYLRELKDSSEELKDKANVVIIGSTAGKFGAAGHAEYAASKSALMYGFTLSMKNEIVKIAPKARVNCVGPGWVRTPMAEESLKNPNKIYRALATMPLKKVALPYDIATQIVVLSSTKISGHVTGQVLMVEGGMEGRLLNKPEEVGLF